MIDNPIRCSSLPEFPDCPRRWAARAMREEIKAAGFELQPEIRGIGASIGISLHKSAEVILREKAVTGELPPATVAADAAMGSLREEIAQGTEYDKRFTPNRADAETQVIRMARSYHQRVAPTIDAIMIEETLEAEVPATKQKLILSGRPDQVARSPNAIHDVKGGTRLRNYNAQIGGYALLARTQDLPIDKAIIDWVPRAPVKHPQPHPVEREAPLAIAESAAVNTLRHIDEDITVWREGDPQRNLLPGDPAAFLSNPSSMLCGARYCSAFGCTKNAWCNDWQKEVPK